MADQAWRDLRRPRSSDRGLHHLIKVCEDPLPVQRLLKRRRDTLFYEVNPLGRRWNATGTLGAAHRGSAGDTWHPIGARRPPLGPGRPLKACQQRFNSVSTGRGSSHTLIKWCKLDLRGRGRPGLARSAPAQILRPRGLHHLIKVCEDPLPVETLLKRRRDTLFYEVNPLGRR